MKDFHSLIEYKPEWRQMATFVPNKNTPIYNWFYYKEGFSRELVEIMLKEFQLKQDHWVLDPFCGSGTTLLACKEHNINAIGFDVLPISVFASKVKTQDYNIDDLRLGKENLLKVRFERISPEKLKETTVPFLKRFFSKYALEDIVFLKRAVAGIEDEHIRDFFTMALVNTAMKVSYAWKDGAVLKARKHPTPPMRKLFKRVCEKMIRDVRLCQKKANAEIMIKQCDARSMELADGSMDAVITSPPYYNQIDYTKVYAIENWFVKNILWKEPAVRSYISAGAKAYFDDMRKVLEEMHRVCKDNAKIAVVIGNGYDEAEGVVESDIILSGIAEETGFDVSRIIAVNERFALKERTKKAGVLRESIIIMEK